MITFDFQIPTGQVVPFEPYCVKDQKGGYLVKIITAQSNLIVVINMYVIMLSDSKAKLFG